MQNISEDNKESICATASEIKVWKTVNGVIGAANESKVAKTEVQSATVNTEIVEKIVIKKVVIKEKGDEIIKYVDNIQYVDKEIIKYITQCPIPESIIKIHNAAALNDNSSLLSLGKESKWKRC